MIQFLVNPSAGRGKVKRALIMLRQLARSAGADLLLSRDAADLAAQARQAADDGVERLVVAGGDGTFHHVAQGLAGTECALGLVPLGRGNDLAAALGTPSEPRAAVDFALGAATRRIDLGTVGTHVFTGYCGVGFDSEAARVADRAPALFRGPLTYVYSVARTLISFRAPVLTVEFDDGEFEGPAMFAAACNISQLGGGMRVAPEARYDDGLLDLVIAERLTRLELLKVFPKVYRGTHVSHPAVRIVRTTSVRIGVDRPLTVACDGELLSELRNQQIEVWLRPRALRVVAAG